MRNTYSQIWLSMVVHFIFRMKMETHDLFSGRHYSPAGEVHLAHGSQIENLHTHKYGHLRWLCDWTIFCMEMAALKKTSFARTHPHAQFYSFCIQRSPFEPPLETQFNYQFESQYESQFVSQFKYNSSHNWSHKLSHNFRHNLSHNLNPF